MKSNLIVTTLCFACLSLSASGLQGSASAQTPAELRQENQRLKAENEQLKRDLETAKAKIASLERDVANLTRALEAVYQGHLPEDVERPLGPGSVDESVPSASPRALFSAMVKSYNEALGEMPVGEPRSRERTAYMRAVQQWRGMVHRELRSTIEWHVRVEHAEPMPSGYTMQMVAIDPKNQAILGDTFEMTLPRAHARLYEQRVAAGEPGLFVLEGILVPNVNVNPERVSRGLFDRPQFIGPFAEFGFTIDSRSLTPVEDKKQ